MHVRQFGIFLCRPHAKFVFSFVAPTLQYYMFRRQPMDFICGKNKKKGSGQNVSVISPRISPLLNSFPYWFLCRPFVSSFLVYLVGFPVGDAVAEGRILSSRYCCVGLLLGFVESGGVVDAPPLSFVAGGNDG